MTAVFLSDVHLRDADSAKTQLVIRFLEDVASRFDRIYLLGDLFDVWPGTDAHLLRKFRPVIRTLKRLVKAGREVHYVEGNHDFLLGKYFSEKLGIQTHPNEHVETWNGKKVYMVHGDLGNPKDHGTKVLRYLLRSKAVHAAKALFPQKFVFQLGMRTSKASRDYGTSRLDEDLKTRIRTTYRDTALRLFRRGYDVVIMGHTHLPDDFRATVDARDCRYVNLGDWVFHFTYLEFDGSQFYTRTHPVKAL